MTRRGTLAAMLIAAVAAAGIPVAAQVKIRILPPIMQIQRLPRINRLPQPPPQLPVGRVIAPSRALQIAGQIVPNGKPVRVRLSDDSSKYVVIVRTNNAVTRVIIDAQTGDAN